MRNDEVAAIFYEIADLIEMSDETDRFRPVTYRRAARAIESLAEDIEDVARQGRLEQIPGIGKAIAGKIHQFLAEGKVDALEKLRAQFPPGLVEIMRIRDIGPKTARRLFVELGIKSVEELKEAAASGRLRTLKGFGEKSEQNILRGIELAQKSRGRILLGDALPIAERIVANLRANAPVESIAFAGSVRRMKETIGDIDVLVTTKDPAAVTRAFTAMREVREVEASGDTKSTVWLAAGIRADLRVLEPASWGAGLQYDTGSKDHNIKLRAIAQKLGLKLSEYGLFREEIPLAASTEEEVYAALGLPYIEPELREDAGEIEAAQKGTLPNLVTVADVRGDLHVHTSASDGVSTLEEMAAAAKAAGYEYLGISDHSPHVRVANGLDEDRLRIHVARLRAFDERGAGVRILAGTECDILPDGTMDYPDRVLAELDYVIAAVHSKFKMPREEMTARVVRAMENEHVDVLAHPTTRKIGEREEIDVDMDRILDVAAERGVALEMNAYPDRTDLGGAHARLAKEHGVKLVVGTDSHAVEQLGYMRFGIGAARRGWLEQKDVLNARSREEILTSFR